ncbi:MAG: hypothetical protein A2X86_18805 [Bdellovibrionales bacterium GWA2_49_15]|nr:MAG: hypothetical protein A2X86_18805 [Bdellovibrionales bacterium GWA2_49_15]HAZ14277.1 molecular chaperone HtpG [Bdellovibrionales bacterium]
MTERKGPITVKTGDIFPIIKKWLYSEHDIFVRELVANATDAITKRASLARTKNTEVPEGYIQVNVNKSKKTITISDNGLGMNEAEVEKYIAQLAFSGAEEFIGKMKEAGGSGDNDIIGKFGLGFYSSFMVAERVILDTLSMEPNAKAVRWICDGNPEYTFADSDRTEIGTSVTLIINEENAEFLDSYKLSSTLKKFCDFMPCKIALLDEERKTYPYKEDGTEDKSAAPLPNLPEIINETVPLWKKDPKELKDEDYTKFYQNLYPMEQAPLFWIHLKIDHPFTLEGILYFPKLNPNRPFNESNIKLYCKQVYVSDSVKNIIPEFLGLLKGCIDSSDIPLNVSRSSLQGDPNVKKISNYVVKKVAESLKKLFKSDRAKFESIWEDSGLFIKYGCVSDNRFDEQIRDHIIFKNSEGKYVTLPEYRESIPEAYKTKLGDKIVYFEKGKSDSSLRSQLLAEKIQTVETEDHIDPHFMQHVESHKMGDHSYKFASVDAEFANIFGTEASTGDDMKIKDLFEANLKEADANSFEIVVEKVKNALSPAYFRVDEQMKRFSKMTAQMGNNVFPLKKTLVINPNNALIQNAFKIHEKGGRPDLVKKLCHLVEDLASISSEGLKQEEREIFVKRSQELVQDLTSYAL